MSSVQACCFFSLSLPSAHDHPFFLFLPVKNGLLRCAEFVSELVCRYLNDCAVSVDCDC